MAVLTTADVDPQALSPHHAGAVFRAPLEPLIDAPADWLAHGPGPDFRRVPLPAGSGDLVHRRRREPIGERIAVTGRVLAGDGTPVRAALVEMWQANAAGAYDDPSDPGLFPRDPNFTGAGRCLTDAGGRYWFLTVRPGATPRAPGQGYRPSHIHFSARGPTGARRLVTRCYIEGDPLIRQEPAAFAAPGAGGAELHTALLDDAATVSGGGLSALAWNYDLVLDGIPAAAGRGNAMAVTPPQSIGSRFRSALLFPRSEAAAAPAAAGAAEIRGQLLDGLGQPLACPGVLLELWAGDQFARTRTDAGGRYRAVLRKPPPARLPGGLVQAPHVSVALFARGLPRQLQTRLYFPDEARANAADPVLGLVPAARRAALVARPGRGVLRFDVRLQGPGETPFFTV